MSDEEYIEFRDWMHKDVPFRSHYETWASDYNYKNKRIKELETVLKEICDTYVDPADTDILEIIKEVIDE